MTTRDQLEGQLAFAQPRGPGDQHSQPQYIQKNAMHEYLGRQPTGQINPQYIDDLGRILGALQKGDGMGRASLQQGFGGLGDRCHNDRRHPALDQILDMVLSPFAIKTGVVIQLLGTQYLDAGGVNQVPMTNQISRGASMAELDLMGAGLAG